MKRIIILLLTLLCTGTVFAQEALNDKADNIVGTYAGKQGDDRFHAKIVKLTDGTYRGQITWLEHDKDAKGNKILDVKNPDKSLRSTPADRIVIFTGLKYNAEKRRWDGTKIYDPQRGIKAKMTAMFDKDGSLRITGSVLGIGESVNWQKIKENNNK